MVSGTDLVYQRANIPFSTPVATVVSIVSLSKYYNARLADRSFAAITPSIWTSLALSFSIITACIPSIKRFLTDWAAGISRAAVIDTFELQHTTGRSHSENKSYTQGTGRNNQLTSKLGLNRSGRSEVTSTCRSHGDREDSGIPVQTRKWQRSRSDDTGDSVKGLTDGMIMHTMDYTVEYEDPDVASLDHNGNTNSGREGAVFKC